MSEAISFPFRIEQGQFPAISTDEEIIYESILSLATTRRGERLMNPDYGMNLHAYVFENNDLALAETLRYEVLNAIKKHETRVRVHNIEVTQEDSTVTVTINYIVLSSQIQDQVTVTVRA